MDGTDQASEHHGEVEIPLCDLCGSFFEGEQALGVIQGMREKHG